MKTCNDIQKIINVLDTTGGNQVYDDTVNRQWGITAEGSVKTDDPLTLVVGLLPYGAVKSWNKEASATEVAQGVIIGLDSDSNEESIAASTQYTVTITNERKRYEGHEAKVSKYSYTSPAAITGTASTDRYNVYYALNNKINAYAGNNVTSYLLSKIAFTGGTDNTGTETDITFGETGTQETSAATVKVAQIDITSGTLAGDNAAGNIWVYDLDGTWSSDSKTLTMGTSAIIVTTAAALTTGQGLVIIDDGSYYQSMGRGGITEIDVTAGFSTGEALVARTGVYEKGQGSTLAARVASYNREKNDVVNYGVQGLDPLNLNDTPNSSYTYTLYTFTVETTSPNALKGEDTNSYMIYLYVSENESTDLGQFETALETVLAKQGVSALA